jgi:hypothetical protein
METTIPLRDTIEALRAEITEAVAAASGSKVRFELGPIELEFQCVAKKEGGAEAKVSFHIFALGASGKVASEETQKVKIVLKPVLVDEDGKHKEVVTLSRPRRAS